MLIYRSVAFIAATGLLLFLINRAYNNNNQAINAIQRPILASHGWQPVCVLLTLICIVALGVETTLYMINPKKNLHQWTYPQLYGSIFNEDVFPPRINVEEYTNTVGKGYLQMKQTRLLVCGLCKNNANSLPTFFERMIYWSQYFQKMQLVLFENDSTDDTRSVIQQWQQAHPALIYLIPCPNDCRMNLPDAVSSGSFSTERMQKMAMFRNQLLTYAKSHQQDFDIVSMIDVDLWGPVSMDGIAHSFGLQDSLHWDCISSYGLTGLTMTGNRLVYYDGLAYKEKEKYGASKNNKSILDSSMTSLMVSFVPRGAPAWPVISGFCGMALYNMKSIVASDLWYDESGSTNICEHVTFHERMAERGFNKHYVNPNMILLAGLQGKTTYFTH